MTSDLPGRAGPDTKPLRRPDEFGFEGTVKNPPQPSPFAPDAVKRAFVAAGAALYPARQSLGRPGLGPDARVCSTEHSLKSSARRILNALRVVRVRLTATNYS